MTNPRHEHVDFTGTPIATPVNVAMVSPSQIQRTLDPTFPFLAMAIQANLTVPVPAEAMGCDGECDHQVHAAEASATAIIVTPIDVAGIIIDALRFSAELQGLGAALIAAIDQAQANRRDLGDQVPR